MSSDERSAVRLEARLDVSGGARLRGWRRDAESVNEQDWRRGREAEMSNWRISEEEERLERGTDMGHG